MFLYLEASSLVLWDTAAPLLAPLYHSTGNFHRIGLSDRLVNPGMTFSKHFEYCLHFMDFRGTQPSFTQAFLDFLMSIFSIECAYYSSTEFAICMFFGKLGHRVIFCVYLQVYSYVFALIIWFPGDWFFCFGQ